LILGFSQSMKNKSEQPGRKTVKDIGNQDVIESENSDDDSGSPDIFVGSGFKGNQLKCHACEGPHCDIVYTCTHALMVSQNLKGYLIYV